MLKKRDIKYFGTKARRLINIRGSKLEYNFAFRVLLFLEHLKCRMSFHDFDSWCITNAMVGEHFKPHPFLLITDVH